MGWRWEYGGAQRGPVTLEVASHGGVWEWHAWVEVAGRGRLLACGFDIATEADARRAAEEAGDAYQRENAEATPDEVLAKVLRARGWVAEPPVARKALLGHPETCDCGGEGWLWGHELRDASEDTRADLDTHYLCDRLDGAS